MYDMCRPNRFQRTERSNPRAPVLQRVPLILRGIKFNSSTVDDNDAVYSEIEDARNHGFGG